MDSTTDEASEALLRYMRDSRGFDFTGYKRTSLMRRVRHRMDQAGYTSFEEYLDVLQASSDEFASCSTPSSSTSPRSSATRMPGNSSAPR
jgi:two-component system, chemotaxis family, CheB/CheR fusion protein